MHAEDEIAHELGVLAQPLGLVVHRLASPHRLGQLRPRLLPARHDAQPAQQGFGAVFGEKTRTEIGIGVALAVACQQFLRDRAVQQAFQRLGFATDFPSQLGAGTGFSQTLGNPQIGQGIQGLPLPMPECQPGKRHEAHIHRDSLLIQR